MLVTILECDKLVYRSADRCWTKFWTLNRRFTDLIQAESHRSETLIWSVNPFLGRVLPSTYRHTNLLLGHHHRLWQYYPNLKINKNPWISWLIMNDSEFGESFDERTSFHFSTAVKWSESTLLHACFSNFCERIDSMITPTLYNDCELRKMCSVIYLGNLIALL